MLNCNGAYENMSLTRAFSLGMWLISKVHCNWMDKSDTYVCPSTAWVRDPAEVLPEVAYELGVSALNLVQVFVLKRCILNSKTFFRP
jgi:hypothetical protein